MRIRTVVILILTGVAAVLLLVGLFGFVLAA
jgi:hypothetical protein